LAHPPAPLPEVLPRATLVFTGEVTEIVESDPPHAKGAVGQQAPRQVVKLEVAEVLFGQIEVGALIEAIKPQAGYALRMGNHGPFLLDNENIILGAYGPDSYSIEALRQAF
jgi:hypothetical protein